MGEGGGEEEEEVFKRHYYVRRGIEEGGGGRLWCDILGGSLGEFYSVGLVFFNMFLGKLGSLDPAAHKT